MERGAPGDMGVEWRSRRRRRAALVVVLEFTVVDLVGLPGVPISARLDDPGTKYSGRLHCGAASPPDHILVRATWGVLCTGLEDWQGEKQRKKQAAKHARAMWGFTGGTPPWEPESKAAAFQPDPPAPVLAVPYPFPFPPPPRYSTQRPLWWYPPNILNPILNPSAPPRPSPPRSRRGSQTTNLPTIPKPVVGVVVRPRIPTPLSSPRGIRGNPIVTPAMPPPPPVLTPVLTTIPEVNYEAKYETAPGIPVNPPPTHLGTLTLRSRQTPLPLPPAVYPQVLLSCPFFKSILSTPCWVSLNDPRYAAVSSSRTSSIGTGTPHESVLHYSLLHSFLTLLARDKPGQACLTGDIRIRFLGSFEQRTLPQVLPAPYSRLDMGSAEPQGSPGVPPTSTHPRPHPHGMG